MLSEHNDQILHPVPEIIVTLNLLALETFYSAFTEINPSFLSRSRCDICLETKQHIVLVDEQTMQPEVSNRHPMESIRYANSENYRSKRKTISIERPSVEAFLVSYRRACGCGIFPVRVFIDKAKIAAIYEDPDGNTIELFTSSFVEKSESLRRDARSGVESGRCDIDPKMVDESIRSWFPIAKAEEMECQKVETIHVKSEPVEIS